jgi:AhpD family alkylhydroperoxidase
MEKKYPPFVESLRTIDPELFEVVSKNFDLAQQPGELDPKTKTLITLALDAIVGSDAGVQSLAMVARKMGASEAEIKETVRIAYMVAANKALVTGLKAFEE